MFIRGCDGLFTKEDLNDILDAGTRFENDHDVTIKIEKNTVYKNELIIRMTLGKLELTNYVNLATIKECYLRAGDLMNSIFGTMYEKFYWSYPD